MTSFLAQSYAKDSSSYLNLIAFNSIHYCVVQDSSTVTLGDTTSAIAGSQDKNRGRQGCEARGGSSQGFQDNDISGSKPELPSRQKHADRVLRRESIIQKLPLCHVITFHLMFWGWWEWNTADVSAQGVEAKDK